MFTHDTLVLPKINTAFANDIEEGLSSTPKQLSSKYFYDEKGDKLFQRIMEMPEYYLTDCEFEIFSTHKAALLQAFKGESFNLIELGAGDGTKTKILLEYFLSQDTDFRYLPIDISANVLKDLREDLEVLWPDLEVQTVAKEYFEGLQQLAVSGRKNVVLFLGGNIGNMTLQEAQGFLTNIHNHLNKGDLLLIGFDLKKDPQTILDAYNDSTGITRDFNLNLLSRINRELGGNFEVSQFKHWETYNPVTGETESFIVSTAKQEVYIEALGKRFHFDQWEAMQTELSLKYSLNEIEQLALDTGFSPRTAFFDEKKYFVNVLWEV